MKQISTYKFKISYTLLFIGFILISVCGKAQSENQYAIISFEKDTINYGTILHNSDPYRTIKFTNTGQTPLLIQQVIGDVAYPVKYPKEPVLPGQSAEIKIGYLTGKIGPFINFIAITSNAVPSQKIIFVKGNVLAQESPEAGK